MAQLYTNDSVTMVEPDQENGTFSLQKILSSIGCSYFEWLPIGNASSVNVFLGDEEARLKGLPRNNKVSALLGYDVFGPVLMMPDSMFE